MSEIKNSGLDQYGAGPFEQQQFLTALFTWSSTPSSLRNSPTLSDCNPEPFWKFRNFGTFLSNFRKFRNFSWNFFVLNYFVSKLQTTGKRCLSFAGFVRRGVRAGFCRCDALTVSQSPLVSESNEKLFRNILYNENHVLYKLLPDRFSSGYNLRTRPDDRYLAPGPDKRNFISRFLFKDIY